MTRYLFEDNPSDREWHRMRPIERAVDRETIALLEQTGIEAGATCLEVGAGAGSIVESIMEWMARRVGPPGHVLAVDSGSKIRRSAPSKAMCPLITRWMWPIMRHGLVTPDDGPSILRRCQCWQGLCDRPGSA